MHRLAFVTLTAAVCLAGSAPATAEDPFVATFTVNGRTLSTGASSARVFAGLFTENGLSGLFGGYTAGVPVVARVSLRGLPGELSYPAGSAALRLQIPSMGIDETFRGATRDESHGLALQWLRGPSGYALWRYLR